MLDALKSTDSLDVIDTNRLINNPNKHRIYDGDENKLTFIHELSS